MPVAPPRPGSRPASSRSGRASSRASRSASTAPPTPPRSTPRARPSRSSARVTPSCTRARTAGWLTPSSPRAGPSSPSCRPTRAPASARSRAGTGSSAVSPTRRSSSRRRPGAARSSPRPGRSSRVATATSCPGRSTRPASAGCLAFLREFPDRTRIVAGIPQLIADLGLADRRTERRVRPDVAATLADVGAVAGRLGREIVNGRSTVDELVAVTDLPVATVLAALTMLERRGLVVGIHGRYRPAGRARRRRPVGAASTTAEPRLTHSRGPSRVCPAAPSGATLTAVARPQRDPEPSPSTGPQTTSRSVYCVRPPMRCWPPPSSSRPPSAPCCDARPMPGSASPSAWRSCSATVPSRPVDRTRRPPRPLPRSSP